MKVCPSCKTRVTLDAKHCPSCGHEFHHREAQKTMMGIPALSESDGSPFGSESSGGSKAPKQTLFGVPALTEESLPEEELRTAMVSNEELNKSFQFYQEEDNEEEDDSTRQVDPSALVNALGGGNRGRGAAGPKATAFGLPVPDFQKEGEAKKTSFGLPVPKRQDQGEAKKTSFGLPVPDFESPGLAEPTAAGPVGPSGSGDVKSTSFGLPAFEEKEEDVASAWGLDEESEDDGSTKVISPEALNSFGDANDQGGAMSRPSPEKAQGRPEYHTLMGMSLFEDSDGAGGNAGAMQFGGSDDEEDDELPTQALSASALEQFQEFGSTSKKIEVEEDPKTAVLKGPPSFGEFQLPKPSRQETPTPIQRQVVSSERSSGEIGRPLSTTHRKDTPRSGVFRVPRKKTPLPDQDLPDDTGVTGTGTYRGVSSSDTQSEKPFDTGGISGVIPAGGGKTSFPTAASSGKEQSPSGMIPRDEDGSPRSGPRFSVGRSKPGGSPERMEGVSTGSLQIRDEPAAPSPMVGTDAPTEQDWPAESEFSPKPSPSPIPSPSPMQGDEDATQNLPAAGIMGNHLFGNPKPPEQNLQNPSSGGVHPGRQEAYSAPQFGGTPAPVPQPQPQPHFGGTPAPVPQPQPNFGGTPAPQPQTAQGTQGTQQAQGQTGESSAPRLIGLVAALLFVAAPMAEVLLIEVPSETVGLALLGLSLCLGIFAALLSALSLSQRVRSIGFGLFGLLGLLGFGAAAMLGMIGALAGGLALGGLAVLGAALVAVIKK